MTCRRWRSKRQLPMLDPIPDQFNLADYYLDHNLREGRADKVAVVYRDEKWTYRQIHEGADRKSVV